MKEINKWIATKCLGWSIMLASLPITVYTFQTRNEETEKKYPNVTQVMQINKKISNISFTSKIFTLEDIAELTPSQLDSVREEGRILLSRRDSLESLPSYPRDYKNMTYNQIGDFLVGSAYYLGVLMAGFYTLMNARDKLDNIQNQKNLEEDYKSMGGSLN